MIQKKGSEKYATHVCPNSPVHPSSCFNGVLVECHELLCVPNYHRSGRSVVFPKSSSFSVYTMHMYSSV